ncbi:phosphatase PAP2 family protein [Sphingobacterium sp. lm-10]|uniref:phosphatase PAP2 family protein n=1 Tax=Sphingobacterium sp. lm-10 TaxID=2944904 RepID=UPI002020CCEF|nr:phosphatase PAP2 family protein [Sphingobacterium sp. lm-10]MCL7986648.1 phosphatase PAP2 family protein [Sphingobacterium sp. lm-10]
MRTGLMYLILRLRIVFVAILLVNTSTYAQSLSSKNAPFLHRDSLAVENIGKSFFKKDAVRIGLTPTIFFAASAATWGSRENIREIRNRYIPTFANHYDDYMQYMPALSVYALNLSGVKGRNNLGRATVSYAMSAAIMAIIVNSIKYTANVERPDASSANSFPSGHTSNAFMNATFMHKEYGQISPMYSVAGYSMSTFTGIGRGLNNRHWISDVLAGAGIGIISTQLGYLFVNKLYKNDGDRPNNFHFENKNNNFSYLSLKMGFASARRNLMDDLDLGIYSQTGFEAGLDGAYYFSKNVGVGADFSFSSFPISTSKTTFIDPEIGSGTSSIITQSVGVLNFTIGPHYTYQISPNWLAHAKVGAGVAAGATGKVSFKFEDDDHNVLNNEIDLLTYKPSRSFKVNGGLSLTRMLNAELGITLYADYHHLRPVFTYTISDDIQEPSQEPSSSLQFRKKNNMDYFTTGLKLTAFF